MPASRSDTIIERVVDDDGAGDRARDRSEHGVRGMDVTPAELRSVGVGLADVTFRVIEATGRPTSDAARVERGALVEALLALGVGVEPTVRGAVANHAYLTSESPVTTAMDHPA